ncbi:hypothetical protein MITSMUL_05118 [Mitsuokella multacida DSM 20544]|uniref:Uncharacterized protein n=1 Tax=Mitsuokella multacida DSM 20544 TaxID=500635 RepID=C9KPG2_9FIRM|nr:hypothetical protein MITSMUL_05118 [Mitsuokella multacida DSM 20544]
MRLSNISENLPFQKECENKIKNNNSIANNDFHNYIRYLSFYQIIPHAAAR